VLPSHLILIKRRRFKLELYQRVGNQYALQHKCRIAVGAVGFTTPAGPHIVTAKARNPDWVMPNSAWVPEELRGTRVLGTDPANPIKEAFLRLTTDGVGIHGTDNLLSLRSRASHGCIRTSPEDAVTLYRLVPVGTPVVVS